MSAGDKKPTESVGFLTVIEDKDHNYIGGYLILNKVGRPLEFHCTTPVRANRAQEILYGPTLAPYVCGEQIGQTLLNTAKITPTWVCTDTGAALAVRPFAKCPVVLIQGEAGAAADSIRSSASGAVHTFSLGEHRLCAAASHVEDEREICERWQGRVDQLDLLEPFSRIREAVQEAQGARTAA